MTTVNFQNASPEDVNLYSMFEVLWRRRTHAMLLVLFCVAMSVVIAKISPKSYDSTAQMVFNQRSGQNNYNADDYDYQRPVVSIDTLMGLIESKGMADRAYEWLQYGSGLTALQLSDLKPHDLQYKVDNPKDTNLLTVTAIAKTPAEAVALANAICYAFIDWNRDLEQADLQKTESSLAASANAALVQLRQAQNAQQALQSSRQIVDLAAQQTSLVDRMQAVHESIDTLNQEVASSQVKVGMLTNELKTADSSIQKTGSVRDDAEIASLQQQLDEAQIALADAEQKYTDLMPGMLDPLRAKVRDLQSRLSSAIHSGLTGGAPSLELQSSLLEQCEQAKLDLASNQAQLSSALAVQSSLQNQMSSMPALETDNDKYQREVDIDRALYMSIRSSLNSTRLMMAKVTGDIQLTNAGEYPTEPARPKAPLYAAVGLMIGIVLAVLIIPLIERKDRRVYTMDKLLLTSPVSPIGGLQTIKMNSSALPLASGDMLLESATAYRMAVANLDVLWSSIDHIPGGIRHSILVTSAVAGEGKTTTAVHIAKLFAESGRTVLLVDADFGNPSLMSVFDCDMHCGLMDILANRCSVDEAIYHTDVPNLSVIMQNGTGQRMESSQLLHPADIIRTIAKFMDVADIVIFDSPPCTASADALQFATHVDTIIQVIGLGVSQEAALHQTTVGLRAARPATFVSFINRLASGQGFYAPYGYYSAYGYPAGSVLGNELEDSERRGQSPARKSLPMPEQRF